MTKKERNDTKFKYAKLIYNVAHDEYYQIDLSNRTNIYTCDKGHITKTIDVDAGCTPFMKLCHCGERSLSSFYKDNHPEVEPTQEWYRPTLEEVLKMSDGMREHVLSGGLEIRDIKSKK